MKKCFVFVLTMIMAISAVTTIVTFANDVIEITDETLPVDGGVVENTNTNTAESNMGFIDVSAEDWFFEGVTFVRNKGIMSGVNAGEFAPYESVTRAMLVVVLHRLEGEPQSAKAEFIDVADGQWYANGIFWAANNGIVNGTGEGRFEPNAPITREQIATILYKYSVLKHKTEAQSVGILAPDKDKISDWALEGMSWAVGNGFISGKEGGVLDPGGDATRAEIATILMRFIKNS